MRLDQGYERGDLEGSALTDQKTDQTEVLAGTDAAMITVGAFEAKPHFLTLLDRVAHGEEVVITKHGKAVARLVPASTASRAQVDDAIAKLKALRRGTTLGGLSWKELRDEGRR